MEVGVEALGDGEVVSTVENVVEVLSVLVEEVEPRAIFFPFVVSHVPSSSSLPARYTSSAP